MVYRHSKRYYIKCAQRTQARTQPRSHPRLYNNWAFTLNNYTHTHLLRLRNSKWYQYVIFGFEVCPTTYTPHLQGYIEFDAPLSMIDVKKLFKTRRVHVEPCRGSRASNLHYCKKGKR